MRPTLRTCRTLAAIVVVAAAGPALAGTPKTILPEAARAIDGGRRVEVLVSQSEIKSDINQSNIVMYTGGGLLPAIIDAAINAERAKKAEAEIGPIRVALTGYDVDALAMTATKAGFERTPWFQQAGMAFTRDSSPLGLNGVLDASPTNQVALVEYAYDMSPDFASIRVVMSVRFANKAVAAGKKPESRLSPRNLVYAQAVTSIVTLLTPSKSPEENAARWAADDGRRARKALAMAFEEDGVLLPRALELKETDLKSMAAKYHKLATAGGYTGRVQEADATSALLFNNGALIHARTIME